MYLDIWRCVVTHPLWRAGPRSRGRWCPRWRSRCNRWNLEQNRQIGKTVKNAQRSAVTWRDSDSETKRSGGNKTVSHWNRFHCQKETIQDLCLRAWPAGMMPMRREQGDRASSGQFGSTPPSACVLQTRPWMISLNMPSPPTHTTLSGRAKKNHQSPGGRRRARWRKLAQKSIFKGTKFKVCFLLFWCCMCHHEGFYLTAKFCPAKGSVLVIWRPLWSSSVADKNRNLQQELFCNLKVSRLSEKRNKIIKSSSFFNSGETEKWIVHLRVPCQLNWFPAVLLLWKATRWFDALTRQAPSAPPLSSGDLWRGWRTRWLQRTTGTLRSVHFFFYPIKSFQ